MDIITTIYTICGGVVESIAGSLFITVMAFIMIMTAHGRFFELYMYTALAPVTLSSFAGEGTSQMGKAFIKSYVGVCLEGEVIVLACLIFSAFASASTPELDTSITTVTMVWKYIGEVIFNMLVLVGLIKGADKIVKEMLGGVKIRIVNFIKLLLNFKINNDIINTANIICKEVFIMPNIKPVSDLRNYTEVLKDISAGEPVFLTKNGRGRYVIIDMDEYEKMQATIKLMSKLSEAEYSVAENGWITEDEARKRLEL